MKDHYVTLGVTSSAALSDIKTAYRQQASLHHPDRNTSPDAPVRFRAIQEAYDVLSDPDKRQAFDNNRQRHLLSNPMDTATAIWQDYFARQMAHVQPGGVYPG